MLHELFKLPKEPSAPKKGTRRASESDVSEQDENRGTHVTVKRALFEDGKRQTRSMWPTKLLPKDKTLELTDAVDFKVISFR